MMQHLESSKCAGGGAHQKIFSGARMWEDMRQQTVFTSGDGDFGNFMATEDTWDGDRCEYVCGICNRGFAKLNSLNQHLGSGAHDGNNYECNNCNRSFGRLAALFQHSQSCNTGTGGYSQARLGEVMMRDFTAQGNLMLTNSAHNVQCNYEAVLYFDGASKGNPGQGGAGFQLLNAYDDSEMDYGAIHIHNIYPCTSNQAEYIGLIRGLESAAQRGIRNLKVRGDSNLVIQQMQGEWAVRSPQLTALFRRAKQEEQQFHQISWEHIYREANEIADHFATNGAYGNGITDRW